MLKGEHGRSTNCLSMWTWCCRCLCKYIALCITLCIKYIVCIVVFWWVRRRWKANTVDQASHTVSGLLGQIHVVIWTNTFDTIWDKYIWYNLWVLECQQRRSSKPHHGYALSLWLDPARVGQLFKDIHWYQCDCWILTHFYVNLVMFLDADHGTSYLFRMLCPTVFRLWFSNSYFSNVYFCKVYPAYASFKLCEFITLEGSYDI